MSAEDKSEYVFSILPDTYGEYILVAVPDSDKDIILELIETKNTESDTFNQLLDKILENKLMHILGPETKWNEKQDTGIADAPISYETKSRTKIVETGYYILLSTLYSASSLNYIMDTPDGSEFDLKKVTIKSHEINIPDVLVRDVIVALNYDGKDVLTDINSVCAYDKIPQYNVDIIRVYENPNGTIANEIVVSFQDPLD
ncbi:MAG: hypothetical protein C0602_08605 [Denitrovibrio sp.]|nr:MAG: hypothetical protein C0602_08605 [Denitrovibrio sp.]